MLMQFPVAGYKDQDWQRRRHRYTDKYMYK